MPPIPRGMLQPQALPTGGRRQVALPSERPGTYERAEAAMLANDRGLDLTPIGDALYRAGSEFVQMEKQRKVEENALAKIKQENAARHYIVEATQRTHDLHATLMAQKIDDPQKAREAFYGGMQAVIDARKQEVAALGPFAEEALAKHYTDMAVKLGPSLTESSIKFAREGLVQSLDHQESMVMNQIASIQDDEVAADAMVSMFEQINKAGSAYMSPTEAMQRARAFWQKGTEARFRFKYGQDEAGAIQWLAEQGLDMETQTKMVTTAHQLAMQEEHREEREYKLMERQEKEQHETAYVDTLNEIVKMEKGGDVMGLARLQDELLNTGDGAFGKPGHEALLNRLDKALNPPASEQKLSDFAINFKMASRDPSIPVAQLDKFYEVNRDQLPPAVRAEWATTRGERLNTEYGRINETLKTVSRQALGIAGEGGGFDDATIALISDPQERAKRLRLKAQVEQTVEDRARRILSFDDASGNNLQALEAQATTLAREVGEAFKPVVAGTQKEPQMVDRDFEALYKRRLQTNSLGQRIVGDEQWADAINSYEATWKRDNPNVPVTESPMWKKIKADRLKAQEERYKPLIMSLPGSPPLRNSQEYGKQIEETIVNGRQPAQTIDQMVQDAVNQSVQVDQALEQLGLGPGSPQDVDRTPIDPADIAAAKVADLKGQTQGGESFRTLVDPADIPAETIDQAVRESGRRPEHVSEPVYKAISEASAKYDVPEDVMLAMAEIESGFKPDAKNPRSSASGLYQFIDSTAEQYGIGDAESRFDAGKNADAGARFFRDNKKYLERRGYDVEPWMYYVAHQQGVGGLRELLDVASDKKPMSASMRRKIDLNGGRGMTAQQFLDMWKAKFERVHQQYI